MYDKLILCVYIGFLYMYIYSSPKAADWKEAFPAKFIWRMKLYWFPLQSSDEIRNEILSIEQVIVLYNLCIDTKGDFMVTKILTGHG